MLGRIINHCRILACAFVDGDERNGIVVMAVDMDGGIWVTAEMRLVTDIDWSEPTFTNFAAKAWEEFAYRATTERELRGVHPR